MVSYKYYFNIIKCILNVVDPINKPVGMHNKYSYDVYLKYILQVFNRWYIMDSSNYNS